MLMRLPRETCAFPLVNKITIAFGTNCRNDAFGIRVDHGGSMKATVPWAGTEQRIDNQDSQYATSDSG